MKSQYLIPDKCKPGNFHDIPDVKKSFKIFKVDLAGYRCEIKNQF